MMKLSVLFLASCLCYSSALPVDVAPTDKQHCQVTLDYRPICGSDGKTYPNYSALNCEKITTPNLEKKSDGACHDDVPPVCKHITRNLQPVCGTDGVTYSNVSLLNCAATKQKKDIKVASEGSCVQ